LYHRAGVPPASCDTGPAPLAPIDAQKHRFERFYRDQNTAGIEGPGPSLHICRQLAWVHQGDLRVESDGDGHGSTFILTLPLTRILAD
jgi:signal transduction histidine kinase